MYKLIEVETRTEYEASDNLPYMSVKLMTLRYRFTDCTFSLLDSDGYIVPSNEIVDALYFAQAIIEVAGI